VSTWKPGPTGFGGWNVTVTEAKASKALTAESPFPWGKHKGTPIKDVPNDYLTWAVHKADRMDENLRSLCEQILGLLPGSTRPLPVHADPASPPFKETSETTGTDYSRPPESLDIERFKRHIDQLRGTTLEQDKKIRSLSNQLTRAKEEIDELRTQVRFQTTRNPVEGMNDADKFRRLLKQTFAALSRKHHPDMGGSTERQTVVNDFHKDLIGRLEGACLTNGKK
jgi:uncharacterized protein (DUF3820 family)/uncharacterized coiled-coil protein SlyX